MSDRLEISGEGIYLGPVCIAVLTANIHAGLRYDLEDALSEDRERIEGLEEDMAGMVKEHEADMAELRAELKEAKEANEKLDDENTALTTRCNEYELGEGVQGEMEDMRREAKRLGEALERYRVALNMARNEVDALTRKNKALRMEKKAAAPAKKPTARRKAA